MPQVSMVAVQGFLLGPSACVDREENTPSSDTETVGGVSIEPEVVVDDIVEGRAVCEAIGGLDALDISAIFSRRVSVMRSPPKFLVARSVLRCGLHEIVTEIVHFRERVFMKNSNVPVMAQPRVHQGMISVDLGECVRLRVVVSSCSTLRSCQDSP